MTSILPTNNNKKIIAKNTKKLQGFNFQPSRIQNGGGDLTPDVLLKDRICDLISDTVFDDAYQTSTTWLNDQASPVQSYSVTNDAANVNQSGYVTRKNGGECRVGIQTRNGKYFSKKITLNRVARPQMMVMKGFSPNSLGKYLLDSFLNSFNTKKPKPTGDINYDNSWVGLNPNDVVVINTSQDYLSLKNYNINHPEASNKIYINKSLYPNKILKWWTFAGGPSVFGDFIELRDNDLHIIQNDGNWPGIPTQPWGTSFGAPKYVVNPFFYDFDFSGVSVINSNSDSWNRRTKTGTLVTKRHMVHVKHSGYTPDIGSTVRFVSKNGNVVERTVISRIVSSTNDFGITLLNEDVPSDIKIYKMLSSNVENYLPSTNENLYFRNSSKYLQVQNKQDSKNYSFLSLFYFLCDQNKNIEPKLQKNSISYSAWDANLAVKDTIDASLVPDFLENTISGIEKTPNQGSIIGDSGGPIFFPFGNELVLIGLNSGSLPTLLPFPGFEGSSISEMINQIGVFGYSVEEPDFSSFSTWQI